MLLICNVICYYIILTGIIDSLEKEFLKVLKTDKMAHSLWTPHDIKLNPVQLRAIELALTNSFQLIQGPPG